jgi:hypothetical protein
MRRTIAIVAVLALLAAGGTAPAADEIRVGPGPFVVWLGTYGYRLSFRVTPNVGGLRRNEFTVRVTRGGRPVDAAVRARFTMRTMPMPTLSLRLRRVAAGVYRGAGMKLTMIGPWEIRYHVEPRGARAFDVVLLDRVRIR